MHDSELNNMAKDEPKIHRENTHFPTNRKFSSESLGSVKRERNRCYISNNSSNDNVHERSASRSLLVSSMKFFFFFFSTFFF